MPDVFLSYSREDQATARRFAQALGREGFEVWWDQTLTPGEAYDRVTEQALESARAVVVLWSRHSVESRWVRAEATLADRKGRLVPALIEPCRLPIMFELTQTADLSGWQDDARDPQWQAFLAGVHRTARDPAAGATPASGTAPSAGAARGQRPSIDNQRARRLAVLPFVNLSSDPEQEYFSDGLTEEILNQLAQTPELRVTGRTSSFAFKGHNEDLRVIADKLGVAHLLEGSVRRAGENLRVTAQLIDGDDGAHRWSRTYDRKRTDVFAVQEEIARDVARALRVSLDVGEASRALGGTTNVEAYERYLRARRLVRQEGRADFLQAIDLLHEAMEMDPRFAQGWALLDLALEGALERDPDDPAGLQRLRAQARARVVELVPESAVAAQIRISELIRDRRWLEAESAARQTGVMVADALVLVGRLREALPEMERRLRQDPLSLFQSTNVQVLLKSAGRTEQAHAEYLRSRTLPGDHGRAEHFELMRLLNSGADPGQVSAQFRVFLGCAPLPMKLDEELYRNLHDVEASRAAIARALEDPDNRHPTRQLIIALYADAFGDRDSALTGLRGAVTGSFFNLSPTVMWYPWRTGLRADPRFKELLREVGVVDYYRASGNWGDYCRPVGDGDFECS